VQALVKMVEFTHTFLILLLSLISTTAQGDDQCCTDTQRQLKVVKSDVDIVKGLIRDLSSKLEQQFKWQPSTNVGACQPGFTYLPASKSCYKVVFERHNWTSAAERCQTIRDGSHLPAITCEAENYALTKLIASELSRNVGSTACVPYGLAQLGNLFWTSGQRQYANDCKSNFVWKISGGRKLTVPFTNWMTGEPNCANNAEFCVDMVAARNYAWNDVPCSLKICPVCEYRP